MTLYYKFAGESSVEMMLKSVKIPHSYRHEFGIFLFFWDAVYVILYCIS